MERTVSTEWRGRTIDAADPEPIAGAPIELSTPTVRATERAVTLARGNAGRGGAALEVAGRLLLRSEGLSSSAIEGLRVPTHEVVLAQEGLQVDQTAMWVADNLATITDALATPPPLTTENLRSWHRTLMRHAPTIDPAHVGTWRPVLGWVGGANPLVAAHVAAPPELIGPAMDDLVAFLRRADLDPVTIAAVAHAQFETIHPFADGNGRIGRALIGWILASHLDVAVPPPASTAFARDIGGYLAGLTLYRQGHVDRWVRWFADAIGGASERTAAVLDRLAEIEAGWAASATGLRSGSAARALVERGTIARHPVIDAALVANEVGVSTTAARAALGQLAERGVLTELGAFRAGPGRPARWWGAHEILALLGP